MAFGLKVKDLDDGTTVRLTAPLAAPALLCLGLAAVSISAGCDDSNNPCDGFKAQLAATVAAGNPDGETPTEVYGGEIRELVEAIRARGCSLPDLGRRPLLCHLGDMAEACPPGYVCQPEVQEVCVRR